MKNSIKFTNAVVSVFALYEILIMIIRVYVHGGLPSYISTVVSLKGSRTLIPRLITFLPEARIAG